MSSLYEYLKNDRENVLQRISRVLLKKMYLDKQYHKDAEHECILAWLEAEYNPFFDNDSIISYAYNCARLRLTEWRRRTLLVVCTNRTEKPEPFGISLDVLHGEAMDRFLLESEYLCEGPLELLIALEEAPELEEEELKSLESIKYPHDPKNKRNFKEVVQMLREGSTIDLVAEKIGVSKRTVYRRIDSIREVNQLALEKEGSE